MAAIIVASHGGEAAFRRALLVASACLVASADTTTQPATRWPADGVARHLVEECRPAPAADVGIAAIAHEAKSLEVTHPVAVRAEIQRVLEVAVANGRRQTPHRDAVDERLQCRPARKAVGPRDDQLRIVQRERGRVYAVNMRLYLDGGVGIAAGIGLEQFLACRLS